MKRIIKVTNRISPKALAGYKKLFQEIIIILSRQNKEVSSPFIEKGG